MDHYLRPREAAARLRISESAFWLLTKRDPSFPEAIKIGPRMTVVDAGELDRWVAAKRRVVANDAGARPEEVAA